MRMLLEWLPDVMAERDQRHESARADRVMLRSVRAGYYVSSGRGTLRLAEAQALVMQMRM